MSYIKKCSDAFINIKLTEIGRKKLSMGQLNFKYWGIGDSEVNYIREELAESEPNDVRLSGTTNIIRPTDRQPNFTSFIYSGGTIENVLKPLTNGDINVMEIIANNEAESRGFYSGDTLSTMSAITEYAKFVGFIANDELIGTPIVDGISNTEVGDWVMFKITNDSVGNVSTIESQKPIPHLWYRVKEINGTLVTFDRDLPALEGVSSSVYYVYPGGEVTDTYGATNESAYWDNGTLSFNASCGVTLTPSPVWNMNIPYTEAMAGSHHNGQTEALYSYYGSQGYLGTMYPYMDYELNPFSNSEPRPCTGISEQDSGQKNIAILHYTNRNISNTYGEFFYINDERTTKVTIPGLMYHRKGDSSELGMEFIAKGEVKTINNVLEYVDLIEEPSLINNLIPMVVGKVFPKLKMIVFENEEIVAAMSYKSNRSWTLPRLEANLVNPIIGANSGILDVEKTMYITYGLENSTSGITTPLAQQIYTKLTNNTSSSRNVSFKLEDVDLLKYMNKIESGWDGTGFYANKFKIIYQIVDNPTDRPDPQNWLVKDFTDTIEGHIPGETIDPSALENQIPSANGFMLTTGGTTNQYVIDTLLNLFPDPNGYLTFGDERFFYGNIDAFIGATTFKTTFDIRVNTSDYNNSSNPTVNPSDPNVELRVSEVGVFDQDKNLVIVGKLMDPIELIDGNTVLIELSLDF